MGIAFLAVLAYNFSIALEEKYKTYGDALDYLSLGITLAKTGKYGHLQSSADKLLSDLHENQIQNKNYSFSRQSAFRPPVWPILIAGVFLVFGYNLTNVIIFKFFLHLIGLYIFHKTLRLLRVHEVILVIGTFLYGISPAWQLYSRVFLSEPVTFFFITLWIYLLIRYIQKGKGLFSQAVIAGILILSHPYYLFLPFSVWFVLFINKKLKLKKLALFSLVATSVVFLWVLRNFYALETNAVVLTTSSGAVMAKGWNSNVIKNHTNTKGDLADEEMVLVNFEPAKNYGAGEVQRMQLYRDATIHFIKTNPQNILPILGRKLLSAFNPLPENPRPGILETGRWIFQIIALLSLLYIVVFSKNLLIKSLAWGLIFSTIGITILTYSGFRFRMPQVGLELLLIIFLLEELFIRRKMSHIDSFTE